MKSPGMLTAAKPLRERDPDLLKEYLHAKHVYKEVLTAEERKTAKVPVQKRLCLEDATIESAQDVLAGSPGGVLLYQDELSGFFGSMDKYWQQRRCERSSMINSVRIGRLPQALIERPQAFLV
jgi:hypothetical protein